ncbi:MAG: hypothetical protein ACLQVD_19245 [Capsulimonadaceae bacterium]
MLYSLGVPLRKVIPAFSVLTLALISTNFVIADPASGVTYPASADSSSESGSAQPDVPAIATGIASDPEVAQAVNRANELADSGDRSRALEVLLDARGSSGKPPTPIDNAIERFVSNGLPTHMNTQYFPELPVDCEAVAGLGYSLIVRPYVASTACEPQSGIAYPRVCYVYRTPTADTNGVGRPDSLSSDTMPGSGDNVVLFCRVHYTDLDDANLALRTGRLLLLGRHVLVDRTHTEPANDDDTPIDVWLCRSGAAGGEQWRNNIYFYDLDTKRSSIEWIREILHEYSHLAIPAVGGFTAPEYWANGYLGERLLIRWLQRSPADTALVEKLWGDFRGEVNYDRRVIQPDLDLYRRIGPNPDWQQRTTDEGMHYFMGQVLTIDDKYGDTVLGGVFSRIPRFQLARPADVTQALQEMIADGFVAGIPEARGNHKTRSGVHPRMPRKI